MRNAFIKILIVALFFQNIAVAQYILKNQDDVNWYANIPQEYVIAHINNDELLIGEYLYFNVNCFNSKTKKLSKNSKVAYIELFAEHGLVFKQKVSLQNGVGQGDYFIPSNLKTGNYKLVVYTQWMKNVGDKHQYVKDLFIINPFENIDVNELEHNDFEVSSVDKEHRLIGLNFSKNEFSPREKVVINISNKLSNAGSGVYTISIKKRESFIVNRASHERVDFYNKKSKPKNIGDQIYLPEYNGEMITGEIINKKTNTPKKGVAVALSLLDQSSKQDIVYTNKNGVFYFHLKDLYKADNAIIQVIDDNREDYILSIHQHEEVKRKYEFRKPIFNKEAKSMIKDRGVHNQIENAFLEVKKDAFVTYELPKEFYGNPPTVYRLDDYKRFPTIAETLTEIVGHAWYKKDKTKKLIFDVRAREFDPYAMDDIKPLVVVDGAYIKDHETVLNDSAYDVETISVLREEYYYGNNVYQGVVNIKTTTGDYYNKLKGEYLKNTELFKPSPRKKYFKQDYNVQSDISRVPDYRYQLLWVPEFRFNSQSYELDFYTSDVSGEFEIILEGYTNNGEYVKVCKQFTVN